MPRIVLRVSVVRRQKQIATIPLLIEALNKCFDSFHETIRRLHFLTVSVPSDAPWD
jgi:hypothetical protein